MRKCGDVRMKDILGKSNHRPTFVKVETHHVSDDEIGCWHCRENSIYAWLPGIRYFHPSDDKLMAYPDIWNVQKTRESISDNDINEVKQQYPLRVLTHHKSHLTSGMLVSVPDRNHRSSAYRVLCLREKLDLQSSSDFRTRRISPNVATTGMT